MSKVLTFPRSYINFPAISYQKEDKAQGHNLKNIKKRKEFIFTGVAIFLIIIFYIFQINLMVERNYQARNLEGQILTLQSENQKLNVEALSSENSQVLADRAKYLGLEQNDNIQYVRILTPIFVQNR